MVSGKHRLLALVLALLMIAGVTAVANPSVYADTAADRQYLEDAVKSVWPYNTKIAPEYGKDTNVLTVVEERFAEKGYPGIKVALKSVDSVYPAGDYAGVAEDGTLRYFYRDPDDIMYPGVFEPMWWRRVNVTLDLSYGTATKELNELQVQLHWDQNKARAVLQEKIIDNVTYEYMLDQNSSSTEVTTDLRLPKTVKHETLLDKDGNPKKRLWSIISWETSDKNAIAIDKSNQGTADTLFDDYIGKVKRGPKDREVTLTATYSFQYGRTTAETENIEQVRTYKFIVKGLDDSSGIEDELKVYLKDYTVERLKYWLVKKPIDPAAVDNDIQFLIKDDLNIPEARFYDLKLEVLSDKPDVIEPYYYRGIVYRPLPGEPAAEVVLTVKLTDKDSGIFATKDIPLTVKPLSQAELDEAVRLMELAKIHYFDGINDNSNPDKDHVSHNLHDFTEVNWRDVTDESLIWFYKGDERVYRGIIPDDIDPSHPSEQWNLFKSSRPDIIAHENLLVTKPMYDTDVTIQSVLTHGVFGKYAEKYPENETFRKLYRQPVDVTVRVLGVNGSPDEPQPDTIEGTLTVVGARVLQDPDTEPDKPLYMYWEKDIPYSVPAGTSALEMTQEVLTAKGYTVKASNHVDSLTHPDGTTLKNYETNGPDATWLWRLNGEYAEDFASDYYLQEGDAVKWYFTNDWHSDYAGDPGEYAPKIEVVFSLSGSDILDLSAFDGSYSPYTELISNFKTKIDSGMTLSEVTELLLERNHFDYTMQPIGEGKVLRSVKHKSMTEPLTAGETNSRFSVWEVIVDGKRLDPATEDPEIRDGMTIRWFFNNNRYNVAYEGIPTEYTPMNDWVETEEGTLYFRNDWAVTGLRKIEGATYFFNDKGVMQTGWKKFGEDVYYFEKNNDGKAATGLTKLGKTTYLFDKDGVRQEGWHTIGGKAMYFKPGRLTGLRTIGKTTYLLSATEGKLSGWHVIGGKAMYFDPNHGCGRITGKRTIGNTTYLLTANGKQYGWHIIHGGKYYFSREYGGGMLTGLRKVGNGTYFFRAKDEGTKATERGSAVQNGTVVLNGKTYRFSKTGLLIP